MVTTMLSRRVASLVQRDRRDDREQNTIGRCSQAGVEDALDSDRDQPCDRADAISAGVPERIKETRATIELTQTLAAPAEVIGFFRHRVE